MRKNLNPMFTHGSVKQFISVFNDKAKQLVMVIFSHFESDFFTYMVTLECPTIFALYQFL